MAQSLNYNPQVESAHQKGNKLASQDDFSGAEECLGRARQLSTDLYPEKSVEGGMHNLRITRDMEVLATRRLVAWVPQGLPLSSHQEADLLLISERLLGVQLAMSAIAMDQAHSQAHFSSEIGMTGVWRGRLGIILATLTPSLLERAEYAQDATRMLRNARHNTMNGDNFYYRAALLGHTARLATLWGHTDDRRRALTEGWRTVARAAWVDPDNLVAAVRTVTRLAADRTPQQVEQSIRDGGI